MTNNAHDVVAIECGDSGRTGARYTYVSSTGGCGVLSGLVRLRDCVPSALESKTGTMPLIIATAAISIVSLAITFFLTDRSHWRKFLLIIGIVAAALASFQAITNRQRSTRLQSEVEKLHQQQDFLDVSKLNALGLLGNVKLPLVESSSLDDLLAPHVKLQPNFSVDCLPGALAAYGSAISIDDRFPFSYYYRAVCNYANKREGWQQDLAKARAILLITTSIPGHNPNHDEILRFIESDGASLP